MEMVRRLAALTLLMMLAVSATARAAEEVTPPQAPKRPVTLTALYGTYASIQALDVVSTHRAIANGAQERNPLMRGGSVGTMIAVKAATGAATIFFAERMWKKNRVGAVIVMAALNGASAAIVARNQRNARR
jgi:hypothetical protein